MNPRTILACLATAILVALGLNLAAPLSSGQYVKSAHSLEKWWPPHPRDQVHLYSEGTTVGPDADLVIYTVPIDKWLTVTPTAMDAPGSGAHAVLPSIGVLGNSSPFQVIENLGGAESLKARSTGSFNPPTASGPSAVSPIGWRFSPGSEVVLRNTASINNLVYFNLFGYLAPL